MLSLIHITMFTFSKVTVLWTMQNSHGAPLHTCYFSERFQSSDECWHLQLQQQLGVQLSFSFLPASVKIANTNEAIFFVEYYETCWIKMMMWLLFVLNRRWIFVESTSTFQNFCSNHPTKKFLSRLDFRYLDLRPKAERVLSVRCLTSLYKDPKTSWKLIFYQAFLIYFVCLNMWQLLYLFSFLMSKIMVK